MRRSWEKPQQTRSPIQSFNSWSRINTEPELGYLSMPLLEETIASHLSAASAAVKLSSEYDVLPLPWRRSLTRQPAKSAAMLNTMAILQAYQAQFLRDMERQATPEMYVELGKATDFTLHMTRCAAQDAGRIIGFSVMIHGHLWLNLTQMSEREKNVLLNAPVTVSGLFGPFVETITHKFEQQQEGSAAFKAIMLCRPRAPFPAPRPHPNQPRQNRGGPPPRRRFVSASRAKDRPTQVSCAVPAAGARGWNCNSFCPQQQQHAAQVYRGKKPWRA